MPVLLPPESYDDWLDAATPPHRLQPLLAPCAPALLQARPIHPRMNRVAHDDPSCLAPPPPPPVQQFALGF